MSADVASCKCSSPNCKCQERSNPRYAAWTYTRIPLVALPGLIEDTEENELKGLVEERVKALHFKPPQVSRG